MPASSEPTLSQAASCRAAALRHLSVLRPLHALVDASRHPRVYALLQQAHDSIVSLYDGFQGEVLADVAPYLVRFELASPLLDALVTEGWGDAWAVYLQSDAAIEDVRRQFRRMLMVRDEAGQQLYFRFYDPRVLRVFLPTATARQKQLLYAETSCYLFEGQDGRTLIEQRREDRRELALR